MTSPTDIDLIPIIVKREHATLPDWCDSWGIKTVQPDLRTYGGYQWPCPGQTAACDPARLVPENTGACPSHAGDGLCVATSWQGMASGGIPARTLLLVAYASAEVLGRDDAAGKLRLPRVAVVALVDGQRLLGEAGSGANLDGARHDDTTTWETLPGKPDPAGGGAMSTRDNGTGQDQIDWLADLVSRHVGVQPFEGQLFCPCGFRLYHPTTGFGAGPVKQRPGQSIGEAAHADHLARVIAKALAHHGLRVPLTVNAS